jgi:hypothetical protein
MISSCLTFVVSISARPEPDGSYQVSSAMPAPTLIQIIEEAGIAA